MMANALPVELTSCNDVFLRLMLISLGPDLENQNPNSKLLTRFKIEVFSIKAGLNISNASLQAVIRG